MNTIFRVGDRVSANTAGGLVVGYLTYIFTKLDGKSLRAVVESENGRSHIFALGELGLAVPTIDDVLGVLRGLFSTPLPLADDKAIRQAIDMLVEIRKAAK